MFEHTRASIGVGVFVLNDKEQILIGKRGPACKTGAGLYALPGGKLDHPESFASCCIRECKDETDIDVKVVKLDDAPFKIHGLLAVTDHFDIAQQVDGKLEDHLSFWMLCRHMSGTAKVMEPTKCLGWEWINVVDLFKRLGDTCVNPTHPQYYWVPKPLWEVILKPHIWDLQ